MKGNIAKPKTDTEILMLRSAETPGPNQYVINDSYTRPNTAGAIKISDANPKSDIDWVILNASQLGPNQYSPDKDVASRLRGGRFSSARPKSDLEQYTMRLKHLAQMLTTLVVLPRFT